MEMKDNNSLWAVCGLLGENFEIGKVIDVGAQSVEINFTERNKRDSEVWNKSYTILFNDSLSAINFFYLNQLGDKRPEDEIISNFIYNFPSEKPNIKKQYIQKFVNHLEKRILF